MTVLLSETWVFTPRLAEYEYISAFFPPSLITHPPGLGPQLQLIHVYLEIFFLVKKLLAFFRGYSDNCKRTCLATACECGKSIDGLLPL